MATSQDFVNWVCGPELDPEFLMRLLIRSRDLLRSIASGAIHKTIYVPTVESFWVCVPDIARQRRIAKDLKVTLTHAESAASLAQAKVLAVRAMRRSVLQAAFEGARGSRWERAPLLKVSEFISDGTHQPPPFTKDGVPFLFVRNVVRGTIDFDVTQHVSVDTYEELTRRRRPARGDVLFSAVGSFGVAVVVNTDRPFTFQRHIAHLRLRSEVASPKFVAAFLNSPEGRGQSERAAMGGAQRTVTLGALGRFEVPLPSMPEQLQTVAVLEERLVAIDALESSVYDESEATGALPAALLRRAFDELAA